MTELDSKNPLLQRPLYVFSLPSEILDTIAPKSNQDIHQVTEPPVEHVQHIASPHSQEIPGSSNHTTEAKQDSEAAKATSCNLCNLKFINVQDQRSHVRSDLHKYNIKQRLKGLAAVSENEFDKLIGDLDESISGSESSHTESDNDKTYDNQLTALLRRQAKITQHEVTGSVAKAGSPFLWFGSPSLPSNVSLGIYRALFSPAEYDYAADVVKRKQFEPVPTSTKQQALQNTTTSAPSFFLCMVGGGHFAAMIVSVAPKLVVTHKGANERQAIVLAHKTFHRYTTRRKQGGSQSANDNAKGAAHSAGAGIRRANEAALQQEIRALLDEWKATIDKCELVFCRATGSENRRTLFGPYDGQVLRSNDSRNRGFPFTTRRATQSELMRAFQELTRVKISHIDEAALKAGDSSNEPALAPITKPKVKPPKMSPEDEAAIHHSAQLVALIKRSKVPAMMNYVQSNKLDLKSFVFKETPYFSPLHMASSIGSAPVVSALLLKCGADPTLQNEQTRTAFDTAKDRSTRDVFRMARFSLGESAWDWTAANVGTALDPADAAARTQRERELEAQEAEQEAARRKAETERLRKETLQQEESATEKRIGKGRALGELTGADKRELEGRGMTPEMRMSLERERRARAAEARMKR